MTDIKGTFAPGFERVAEAFAANFADRGEVGAAFAIVRDGEVVLDLRGGTADAAGTRPWDETTVVNVWSTTKAVTALCFAILVDRGQVAYDDLVSRHWPEFAAAGKERVTVGMLLSHQAGLCSFRDPATVTDFYTQEKSAARLAATEPLWEPGSRSGYHAITIGLLANEVFRRITGQTLGEFVRAELASPYGLDLSIGLPVDQDHRRAEMIAPPELASTLDRGPMNPSQIAAFSNPVVEPLFPNTPEWRAAEVPSANGFANARSLARLFGAAASGGGLDGHRLLGQPALDAATALQIEGVDEVLGVYARWGAGFLLNPNGLYGPEPRTFGHSGWGGSFAFADPVRRLGVSYVMNRMGTDLVGDPRATALIAATYEAV